MFVVLAIVIVIIVVYFSFFYPPPSSTNLTGTMAGIEKGKRDIGKQFTVDEIIIENPEINDIIQSADFQNLIKDENFRKAVLSSDFQDIIVPLMSDFQQYVYLAQEFQEFVPVLNTPDESKNFIQTDEFKKGFSQEFQNAVLAIPEDKLDAVLSQESNQKEFFNAVLSTAINSDDFGFSQNFIKAVLSQEFQNNINNLDVDNWAVLFANPVLTNIIPEDQLKSVYLLNGDNIDAIKAIYSNENFKAVLFNEDFIKVMKASDFQQAVI